jgi:hypothetical protein
LTPRRLPAIPSVIVPLVAAGILAAGMVLAVFLERRAPSPDANIGLGLLWLGGLPVIVLLLLWALVRALVLLRRGRP